MALSKDMAASLSNSRYKEMGGEVRTEWTTRIHVPKRARPLTDRTVAEIEESIEQVGLLQPIGVKAGGPDGYHTTLIFGVHRHEAWRRKLVAAEASGERDEIERWQMIPVIVYPADMPVDLAEAVELIENLKREDLTQEQRQQFAARLAKWSQKEREAAEAAEKATGLETNKKPSGLETNKRPKSPGRPKGSKGWFAIWVEDSKTPANTAKNWWKNFCAQTGRAELTPEGAKDPDKAAWNAWLEAQKEERLQAAAEAEAKAKADAEHEARDKRRARLVEALNAVIDSDGQADALQIVREVMPDLRITAKPVQDSAPVCK